ncbi:hypothetical protein D3C76_1846010 [compost metagenome]
MLAARDGQDDRSAPANRLLQRSIRRRIAGVERNDHVNRAELVVIGNVADEKTQVFILQLAG